MNKRTALATLVAVLGAGGMTVTSLPAAATATGTTGTSVTTVSLVATQHPTAPTKIRVVRYASCKELNKVHKHGVGRPGAHDRVRGHTKPVRNFTVHKALYLANRWKLDRDRDGIACEKL